MRYIVAGFISLFLTCAACAQDSGVVVQNCGTAPAPYTGGGPRPMTVDLDGHLCVSAQGNLPFTNGYEGPGQFNTASLELLEGFDTAVLNTTNNWQTPTQNGTGVIATSQAAQTILNGGTTTTSWSKLQSIKTFLEDNPGYHFFQTNINITPALGATGGSCMFFGFGTPAASPACGAMAGNAAAFETTTDGRLLAVTYASNSRTIIADLSIGQGAGRTTALASGNGQPTAFLAGCQCVPQGVFNGNTNSHRVVIYFRGDNIVWAVEGQNGNLIPVVYTVSGVAGPDVNALPVSYEVAVGPANVGVAGQLQVNQVTTARTSARLPSLTPVVSAAAESAHILKTYPGHLVSVYATNLTATAGFLVVLNSATVPADGAITPLDCVPLPANTGTGFAQLSYGPGSFKHYNVGLTAVITSAATCFTKTTGVITGYISGQVQ